MNDKTEKVARQIEKVIHEFGGGGLHIDGGELRDILEEEFEKPMPDEVEKIIEHAAPNNDKLREIAERCLASVHHPQLGQDALGHITRAMQEWGDIKSDSDNDCLVQGNLMLQQQLERSDREFAELKCQNESLIREVERLREREKYDHFPHTPKDWPT